ncbi:MAG: glycoside hydrolase family 1 protein [Candidatus Eisenbacteria bacterium]|uniref:Glycoside hydrolase family 1 protein n=1 Tax=Eiseniibacteriota bacterium TaxID=2212470 RepID=A0A849SJG0_UNCEI|nr:glycoside hydrolase family 1 protein [Candidatus Eisenbacteria bacterium]
MIDPTTPHAAEAPPSIASPDGMPHAEHAAEGPGIHSANFRFPPGFLWGAATSSHQVEGGNTNSDWWAWEQSGRVKEPSGAAADHFNRYGADFDLARSLNHNAYRFSLEWSRIEPREGEFSAEGIAHYRQKLEALKARGMEPVLTIYHYTLPQWLAEKGGWENPEIENYFERFVVRVAKEYGDLVRWWLTFNEPVVQAFKGWILGQWPPGKMKDFPTALQVVRRMLRAHVKAYHAIHEARPDAMVSVAKHALALTPCNPKNRLDRLSVWARTYLFNHLFLDALHTGALRVPGLFWENLPHKRTLDFIGLNYYTRDFVRNTGLSLPGLVGDICTLEHHQKIGKRNDLGWEIYPEGLAHFLRTYSRYQLPILITENGLPVDKDEDRWTFIFLHLWQVARALDEGINVIGYLHWSLLDNYEWADGFKARFGLIEVDYATQKRTVRESAKRLASIIERNEL